MDSNIATVSITVLPVNDPPTAADDAYSVNQGETLNVPAPGVLDNDGDVDGDGLSASLVSGPAYGALTLNPDGSFSYTPSTGFSGSDVFTYEVSDGNGGTAVGTVTITVASAGLIYAVHDQGEDDSQFFTISLDASHTVTPLGPLQHERDIEGLDLHPTSGVLYAASGREAERGKRGCLYTVDKNDATLTLVGCTGFTGGVQALAFRPDGTLWGWAQGKGLITIDIHTGAATRVLNSNKSGDALAWNNEGTRAYIVAGTTLFEYDPDTNKLTRVASSLPGPHVEALEMRPDGLLAVGVHGSTTMYAYDVINKQVVSGESISIAPYNDLEGIAWPN